MCMPETEVRCPSPEACKAAFCSAASASSSPNATARNHAPARSPATAVTRLAAARAPSMAPARSLSHNGGRASGSATSTTRWAARTLT